MRSTSVTCFNTTLVQLKEYSSANEKHVSDLFQYHSGPIKRLFKIVSTPIHVLRFNTTLVQLKDEGVFSE